MRTSVVVRRSWSTYATDTAPLARSATAPLSQEQGIRAQPDRPVTAPVTGHFLPLLQTRDLMQVNGPHACGAYWHARAARATMTGWLVMTARPCCWRAFMSVLDGARPSRTRGWVSPVAPVVTQAAAGAGHWAAGRRQRALAEWAGAAGFGLVAWGLGTEAPTRAEVLENLAALAGMDDGSEGTCCASLRQRPRLPPRRKHPRPAGYRGSSAGSTLFPR